jgi:hypothetical protein
MRRKKSALSTQPGEFKGTVSRENEWGFIKVLERTKYKLLFLADITKFIRIGRKTTKKE